MGGKATRGADIRKEFHKRAEIFVSRGKEELSPRSMPKIPKKIPEVWATTAEMAAHLGLSVRRFRELRQSWADQGQLQQGKHWVAYSARTHRFNRDEVAAVARRMGRILPKIRPSQGVITHQHGVKLLRVSGLQHLAGCAHASGD